MFLLAHAHKACLLEWVDAISTCSGGSLNAPPRNRQSRILTLFNFPFFHLKFQWTNIFCLVTHTHVSILPRCFHLLLATAHNSILLLFLSLSMQQHALSPLSEQSIRCRHSICRLIFYPFLLLCLYSKFRIGHRRKEKRRVHEKHGRENNRKHVPAKHYNFPCSSFKVVLHVGKKWSEQILKKRHHRNTHSTVEVDSKRNKVFIFSILRY